MTHMQNWHAVALVFGQTVVAATFLASLVSKLRDPEGFEAAVRSFKLVAPRWIQPVARTLTAVEVVTVALLLAGYLPAAGLAGRLGLGLGGLLLLGYTAALTTVRVRGMRVACHCFGASPAHVSWYDVARNLLLLACAGIGLSAGIPDARLSATDTVLVALVGVCAALLVTNLANVVLTAVQVPGTAE